MPRNEIHPRFIEYTMFIATHPAYLEMPDCYKDDGEVQWEAPSNRLTGKYKDSHHKRRDWWRNKAAELGIDPESAKWISRTAKQLHPTKEKPCGVCGRVMSLEYVYPSSRLAARLVKFNFAESTDSVDELEDIYSLVHRLSNEYDAPFLTTLPKLLKTSKISPPTIGNNLDAWLSWIRTEYVPQEPRLLSPGAMANPPDRFDGFHTYNRCCRSRSDKGRSKENLKAYTTDRRVFENWNEGDWISADRLMGLIRRDLGHERCLNGHPGPCSADHIGPLSLGFTHRPEFQLLCTACNSAKNNRMTLRDVQHLLAAEARGETVISWYASPLWEKRKIDVFDEETALRLSKLLRDNRHIAIQLLGFLAEHGHYAFLMSLLELQYANYNINFKNLRIENYLTTFDQIQKTPRTTKYALEQKSRKIRVAFEALRDYFSKPSRNVYSIKEASVTAQMKELLHCLDTNSPSITQLDSEIASTLDTYADETEANNRYSQFVTTFEVLPNSAFQPAILLLHKVMDAVSHKLSPLWDDERYRRDNWDVGPQTLA